MPQPAPCATGRDRSNTHIFYFLKQLDSSNFMQITTAAVPLLDDEFHAVLGGRAESVLSSLIVL
jgi:hypothetical protein